MIAVVGLLGVAVVASRTLQGGSTASATANTTTTATTAPSSTAAAKPSQKASPTTQPAPKPARATASPHSSRSDGSHSTTTTAPRPATPKKANPAGLTSAQVQAAFPKDLLVNHPAPAHSATCNAHPRSSPTPTTTLPASGHRVSIVAAPAGVGFPALDGSSPRYTRFSTPPPFCINTSATYRAAVRTDAGTFTLTLLPKAAPVAVNNFVFLAGYHYYNGTIFQRVVPHFLDQGGDPLGTGYGGPGYTFRSETPRNSGAYLAGAVGMANAGPDTNGSQFFIAITDLKGHVPDRYTVFAAVTSGMSVLDTINRDATTNDKPTTPHRILSITITRTN